MSKVTTQTVAAKAPPVAASAFVIEVGQGATPVDEGAYSARIQAVFDLGVQAPPQGGKGAPRRQLAVGFELHGATCLDVEPETPPIMFRRYGLSWGPKAELPKLLRALLGRDAQPGEKLSPAEWIGKPVTCTVEHTQRTDGSMSARIAAVTRCTLKSVPELAAEPLLFPGAALSALPEWASTAIAGALHASTANAPSGNGYDADVPQ
jgi:hypothetical protein